MSPYVERRAALRVPTQCVVRYFYLPPSLNPPSTRVIDLSLRGACIEVPDPLIPGSIIAFQIITSEHHVVDVRARVVYALPRQDVFYRAGVSFTHISETDPGSLEREIARALSALQA